MKAIVKEVRSTQPKRYTATAIVDATTGEELFRAQHEHGSESAAEHSERAIVSWERSHPEYEVEWQL